MRFSELSAHPALLRALDARGYAEATAVQAAVSAPELRGRDLLVSSQTGSGKTIAFGLALAPTLLGETSSLGPPGLPLGLVVAPTRELAQQVARELSWLYASAGARVATCVGGTDARAEARSLAAGAHLVVGTPARLCDHLERRWLRLEALRAVVLDEADEMLDLGFREELERILRDAPPARRTLLFSATLPKEIEALARQYQRDATRVSVVPAGGGHADIEYRAYLVAQREREHAVVNLLRASDEAQALVFCETRSAVTHLHASLAERGFSAVAISGELTQAERTRALQALRDGRARILVATDVAARGLDLPDVALVIHADLPHDAEVLQHRSGRTGRAGKKGVAAVVVPFSRKGHAERLLFRAKARPQWLPVPTAEQVRALDEGRLVSELAELAREPGEDDLRVARRLLEAHGPEPLAAALVKLRRAQRPAPEDLPETAALMARGEARSKPPAKPFKPMAPRHRPAAASAEDARPHAVRRAEGEPRTRGKNAPPRTVDADAVWFTVNVGRLRNADPRWLVPLLCRRGGISKAEIGRIQIGPKDTRVAIAAKAARRFADAVKRPDPQDPKIRIFPSP